MTNENPNYIRIETQAERVSQANLRVLSVIEERGTPEQIERVRQTFTSSAPPANHPHWPMFLGETVATLAEMVDGLLAKHEPKKRGRPPKKKPEEGDAA